MTGAFIFGHLFRTCIEVVFGDYSLQHKHIYPGHIVVVKPAMTLFQAVVSFALTAYAFRSSGMISSLPTSCSLTKSGTRCASNGLGFSNPKNHLPGSKSGNMLAKNSFIVTVALATA